MSEVNATDAAVALAEAEGVDLDEVEGTGQDGRITKDDVEAYLKENSPEDDEDVESTSVEVEDTGVKYEEAEVEEVQPLVREGMFVQVKEGHGVPQHFVNRDCAVVRASVHRTSGPSTLSNDRVEYQLDEDPILIRLRDTGEELEVRRAQVALLGETRADLGGSR